LHENGCPWDNSTCCVAALREHWDCLKYAVDNKCPRWDYYEGEFGEYIGLYDDDY
jgi:hypothetical protein